MTHRPDRLTVFFPFRRDQANAVREAGGTTDRLPGYRATDRMKSAHGYQASEEEDAAYAAQVYAAVAGLRADDRDTRNAGLCVVVAADVAADTITEEAAEEAYGAVTVAGLRWAEVTAVFTGEKTANAAVRAAAAAVAALPPETRHRLEDRLSLPAIEHLTDDHEQLWHHPAEDW